MPTRTPRMGLTHLNGHILCAVDVETTGDIPGEHDMIQICILPLDYRLEPWEEFLPFYNEIKPKRPENFDPDAKKMNRVLMAHAEIYGLEWDKSLEIFDEWYAKFNLAPNKRIVPLAQNWPFDREFIIDWMGRESFNQAFDSRYRDLMTAASFENDRADFHCEVIPYPHVNLRELTTQLKIEYKNRHDALADCYATAKTYKKLVSRGLMA
jgi:DNA polymerase III epsilon subunit-like protein